MKFYYLFFFILLFQCTTSANLSPDMQAEQNRKATAAKEYTGTLIEITFVNKGGKVMEDIKELYFKINEDEIYFIKFSYTEGSITAADLRPHLNKTITIQGEIKDGLWDVQDDNPMEAQSRIGKYLVVLSIH
jgi:hypothetical protein